MSEKKQPTSHEILAAHYKACFETPSGIVVLDDLIAKYADDTQPVFVQRPGLPYDLTEAAVRDGRRQVVSGIRLQIKSATPAKKKAKTQTKAKR